MNPPNPLNLLYKKAGILIGIVAVLAVVVVTFANENPNSNTVFTPVVQTSNQSTDGNTNTNTEKSTPPSDVTVTPTVTTKKTTSVYKNGTYTADGSYDTPEGQVSINVSLTIANDLITDANVTSVSGERTSIRYQNKFISGYKQYVVGKNIADVQLSKVSGSSLTPEGFNNAVEKIKAKARS